MRFVVGRGSDLSTTVRSEPVSPCLGERSGEWRVGETEQGVRKSSNVDFSLLAPVDSPDEEPCDDAPKLALVGSSAAPALAPVMLGDFCVLEDGFSGSRMPFPDGSAETRRGQPRCGPCPWLNGRHCQQWGVPHSVQ